MITPKIFLYELSLSFTITHFKTNEKWLYSQIYEIPLFYIVYPTLSPNPHPPDMDSKEKRKAQPTIIAVPTQRASTLPVRVNEKVTEYVGSPPKKGLFPFKIKAPNPLKVSYSTTLISKETQQITTKTRKNRRQRWRWSSSRFSRRSVFKPRSSRCTISAEKCGADRVWNSRHEAIYRRLCKKTCIRSRYTRSRELTFW